MQTRGTFTPRTGADLSHPDPQVAHTFHWPRMQVQSPVWMRLTSVSAVTTTLMINEPFDYSQ